MKHLPPFTTEVGEGVLTGKCMSEFVEKDRGSEETSEELSGREEIIPGVSYEIIW